MQECTLFKARLDRMMPEELSRFMTENGLRFEIVSNDEKDKKADKLINLSGVSNVSIIKTTFYK